MASIRPVDESHAEIIAQAFEEHGQETAIVVRYGSGAEGAPKYIDAEAWRAFARRWGLRFPCRP